MSRSKKLIVTALFLIGACILLYPAVSNKLAERHQAEMISRYEQTVEELPKTDMKSEWEKAVKYNESVTGMSVEDPFILGSGSVLPGNYKDVLNVEEKEGVMGYIEIPAIDVMLPIYHGVSERVLRRGVGHMETTALPIGGKGTHSVLASHRGLSTAKLFTDLDRMKEGDLFYIHVLDHLLTYEVDQISVIEPEDTDALRPIADKEYITLLTCTPYGVNSHRLLVRGEKICDEIVKESEEKESDTAKKERDITDMVCDLCVGQKEKSREEKSKKEKKMKRVRKQRKLFIFGLILLLIGCGILLYPHILQKFYKIKTESMFRQFEETTENVRDANPEKYARLYEEMKNYNEELIKNNQENLADPYAYANPAIRLEEYGVEDGIAGYIKIPVMDLELPLYLGANEENMSKGAAQLTETSMPIGGNNTNMAVVAHRGYSYAKMFREIEKLKIGDEIFITNFWETMTYKVERIEVISPDEIDKIRIQEGKDMVTLVTCHPYPHNYQRYLVYCERV